MHIITKSYAQVAGDCNNDEVYEKFNELTGLDLEFVTDQEYGTGCYGISHFSPQYYPTLEDLEIKIEDFKAGKQPGWKYNINSDDVFNYLRRKGILPEEDILFNVDY